MLLHAVIITDSIGMEWDIRNWHGLTMRHTFFICETLQCVLYPSSRGDRAFAHLRPGHVSTLL